MAKAVPPNDPRKLAASKGRPPGAAAPGTAAPLDEAQIARIAEKRREAEALLASQNYEAAGQILLRLARLPQEEVRETAAWARQQLLRVRKQMGTPAEVSDSVALAPKTAAGAPDAASTSTGDASPAGSTPSSESSGSAAESRAGESLANRVKQLATSPLAAISGVACIAFLVGFLVTAAAVRPPTATLVFEVEEMARGKEVGLGIDGRLHEVDTLEQSMKVSPGRQTIAVTEGRKEWAALELDLASGDIRTLRVVWREGHPEVHLLGTDDSVLAKSLVPRPLPPPPADKPVTPKTDAARTVPNPQPQRSSAPTPMPTPPANSPSPGTDASRRDDAAIVTAIFHKSMGLANFNITSFETNPPRNLLINQSSQIPKGRLQILSATLSPEGIDYEQFALLKDAHSLGMLTLVGEWTGDEIKVLVGHPALRSFTQSAIGGRVPPGAATIKTLRRSRAAPHLAQMPVLSQVNLNGLSFTDDDLDLLKKVRDLQGLGFASDELTPRGLATLSELPRLGTLYLRTMDPDADGFSDEKLEILGRAFRLHVLTLEGGTATGAGFRKLDARNLQYLTLQRFPALKDEGIQAIASFCKALTTIHINVPQPGVEHVASSLTNDSLKAFQGLEHLRSIRIQSAAGITDEGVAALVDAPVTMLDLSGCSIGDGAAESLSKMKLEYLWLERTQIGDETCRAISRLPLRQLLISNTKVTDAGMTHLKEIKTLETVDVRQTEVTQQAVDALKAANTRITIMSGR
ncbi:MAG: hypothetical protein IT428_33205 [Planctomycetaceae bacterium]|nr:hypothetical protein [Planctomycetaceae bacterium]